MNYLIFSEGIIYIISDITAGIFLTVLVVSTITHQIARRPGFTHLFAATMLILAGIFARLFAVMMGLLPEGTEWKAVTYIPLNRSADVIWIMAFILILTGIGESVIHAVYVNESEDRTVFRPVLMISGITGAAGILLYIFTRSIDAFTLAILVQLLSLNIYLYRSRYERAGRQFGRASMIAIITFVIPLILDSVRLTGLGLSLMLIILNEQYHERLGQKFAENEAALVKSRLQLLTDQISPHYIYNSLQSIRDLCGTDPVKARDAIDFFSEYIRGNLESLTIEELIPFTRELELTQAYLELEKLTGRRPFEVGYQLETVDFMLPPLVLQPVVENAVKYGTARAISGAGPESGASTQISISTREQGENIRIEVTDRTELVKDISASGDASKNVRVVPHTEEPKTAKNRKNKTSIGLENVSTRLALQSGGTIEMESTDEGTRTVMILPKTTMSEKQ